MLIGRYLALMALLAGGSLSVWSTAGAAVPGPAATVATVQVAVPPADQAMPPADQAMPPADQPPASAPMAAPAAPQNTATPALAEVPLVDAKADAILRGMSDFLASQARFRVHVQRSLDLVLDNGQKIQADSSAVVTVQRPDRLRIARKGVSNERLVIFDGQTLTLAGSDGLYATAAAPATLDAFLDRAIERLGLVPPGADLLYANPYQVLTEDLVESTYIGQALINGVRCDHLAFRNQSVDWQLWVEAGPRPLPCKMAVTARETEQAPQFVAYYRNWDLQPVLGADEFSFTPPPGATQIDISNAAALTAQ